MGRRNKDWQRLLEPVPGIDWARVIIHGLFGLVVGGIIGFRFWVSMTGRGHGHWLWIALPAVAVGAIAAVFGDRFWEWVCDRWLR